MMSDHHRRRSPESSRRRRRLRRDSREQSIVEDTARATTIGGPQESTVSGMPYYPSQPQSHLASSAYQQQTAGLEDYQAIPPISMRSNENTPHTPSMSMSMPVPIPAELNRPRRQRRRGGSGSSSELTYSTSASSSSSSSYLDISRWYPSFGRSGGVLKAFFKTPSEHRPRRRRSGRKLVRTNKAKGGVFGFGNNSSSSSVDSDMAYGMGFIKKPKSRGGGFSPDVAAAAASSSSAKRAPPLQRRQTDEEIMEIGRKLAEVARKQNREDLRHGGGRHAAQLGVAMGSWDKFQRQSSSGLEASSRGLGPSRHGGHHHASSSDDDSEWESASEDEDSDEASALAYGHSELRTPRPAESSLSRTSKGPGILGTKSSEGIRHLDRKSSVVDPQLFGPYNSLRDFINTPCGFNDGTRAYTIPETGDQRYVGSAESASFEARPMQRVFPLQTSDPGKIEAARASGSVVSSLPNYSTVPLRRVYSTASADDRPDPIPIQAPKPIAPVPSSMYDEERIPDTEPSEPREPRRNPSDSKIFAETALVGAGVAALGAAMLARRDKGKDPEQKHNRDDKYGHDDHREDGTKVLDARKAKELALEKEIERLERALAGTNKAREQRRRESKRLSDPRLDERSERSKSEADVDKNQSEEGDRDYQRERERRRQERISRFSEPAGRDSEYGTGEGSESARSFRRPTSNRVSEPSERPAAVEEDFQLHHVEDQSNIQPKGPPIDVFQFQDPDDASRSGDTLVRSPSPLIINVSPAPSSAPEQGRKSRRDSFEDEMRDAQHIYEEATHSTAPIDATGMAAAIAATEYSRRQHEKEWRSRSGSRSGSRTPEDIQEEADRTYRAERVARSSSSGSRERSVVDKYEDAGDRKPRVVTPPGMSKPKKGKYSEPDADVLFDNLMSPTELRGYWPREAPVLDPTAQRPRPVLNLVMPTPVPTPTPEKQEEMASSKDPKPAEEETKREASNVVLGPKGEAVEIVEVTEPPQTPKSVSWGPSETKQYEVESREASLERPVQASEKPSRSGKKSSGGGWSTIAAAITGASVGAALARDDKSEPSRRDDLATDLAEESSGPRSPPKERPILPAGISSHVPEEEPEELPPVPGPKPASPRHSQMPGAFGEDLDFTATLAAGLEHSGFDPEIVIENPEYRRRESPPGSNQPLTGVYMQPFVETATDLGIYDIDDGSGPLRTQGYVIGEVADMPASERAVPFEQVVNDAEQPQRDAPKLSKKEQRKLEKAAKAAKLAEQEEQTVQPVEAGEDEWADAPGSKKAKKSKKAKRSSVPWDDIETPEDDNHVSVPTNAFDDIKDTTGADDWDTPKESRTSKRNSKGYDVPEEEPLDRRDGRPDSYVPIARDDLSVVSDSRYDDRSNGYSHEDDRSVVSAPPESNSKRDSKSEKRSSGGFWGILRGSSNGEDIKDSKKDNAGTLGAGAGLAGAAVAIAALARSDAAEASQVQEERHSTKDFDIPRIHADSPSREVDVLEDPEVAPRVIKPAIDPQYGDLLPLPPSPSEKSWMEFFEDKDNLPSLPDSRPATPPGQERALLRERESSQKRPTYIPHSRRPSSYEASLRSPSHTAIPIQFRMSHHRTSPAATSRSSPVVGVRSPPTVHSSPDSAVQEFSPTFKRQPPSRPTSWDSSREFKPLYLLEQAGRSGRDADEESHDEVAELTPLPPSRESPAPEGEAGGDEVASSGIENTPLFVDTDAAHSAALGSQEPTPLPPSREPPAPEGEAERVEAVEPSVKSTPLFVDTDVARSAPLGSQESTPRFPKRSEQEFQSPPTDVASTLHEVPSSSSLSESNYATPVESPSQAREIHPSTELQSEEGKRTASPRLESEPEPVQVLSEETADEQEKKSYFPSALSILPAATLAGVGVLLGRGKGDGPSTDDHGSEKDVQKPLSRSANQTSEINVNPQVGLSEVELTSLNRSADLGDSRLPASESQDVVTAEDSLALTCPHEAEVDPVNEAESNDTPAPSPVDAGERSQPSSSKKKKKGKNKKSVSDVSQVLATAETGVLESSDMQRDAPIQGDTVLEEREKPLVSVEASEVSEALAENQQPADGDVEVPPTNTELPIPLPTDSVDTPGEGQHEKADTLDLDQAEVAQDSALNQPQTPHHETSLLQPETTSEDLPEQTTLVEEPASITPEIIREVIRGFPEASGDARDAAAGPAEDAHLDSADVPTERSSQPTQSPIDDDSAPAYSKKSKKNKKKKKQSISLTEDVVESPAPDLPDDKAALGAKNSSPTHDHTNIAESPQGMAPEQSIQDQGLNEPLKVTSQPLGIGSAASNLQGQSHVDSASLTEEPAAISTTSVGSEDPPKNAPTQPSPIIATDLVDESDLVTPQPLVEKPELQSQEAAEPTPALAEEEFPIIPKKSKKNKKKRKGSAVIDESIQSSGTEKPEELEQAERPSGLPRQPAMTIGEDLEPEMLPSQSQDVSAAAGDAKGLESSDVEQRSSSQAKERTEPLDLSAQAEVLSREISSREEVPFQEEAPVQEGVPSQEGAQPEVQPDALPLQSTEIFDGSPQRLDVAGPDGVQQEVDLPEPETEHADLQGSKSQKPLDASQTINTSLEPTISPAQEELSINTSTSVHDQSSVELEEGSQAILDQEARCREAETAQIQEEKAELARIQLKRKPSKKEKQRLKDLKARAEKRAEEAEAAATSSGPAHAAEQSPLEAQETAQPSTLIESKGNDLPPSTVEDAVLADRGDESSTFLESQRPDMKPEILGQTGGVNLDLDTSARAEESHPPSQKFEHPEETTRHEAEAALIEEEEAELSRLKIKRKPSKKDKERIKALKANAERRDQEAQAAAQRKMEGQSVDIPQEHDDVVSQPDANQEAIQSSVEDTHQPALEEEGSESAEGRKLPPVDVSTEPWSEDHAVADMESTSLPPIKEPILRQPEVSTEQDVDTTCSPEDATTQLPEHRDGQDRKSLTQDRPESQIAVESLATPQGGVENIIIPGAQIGKDHEETALDTGQDDINQESIPQQVETSHPSVESQSSQFHDDVLPSAIAGTSSSPVQDPISLSEGAVQHQEKDITTDTALLEPQQSLTTEAQPDPEWVVPSRKSKKDKKKKRKETISSESGPNSGFATPLERNEPGIAAEREQMGETLPSTSQEEQPPPTDRGDKPLDQMELAPLEQNSSTVEPSTVEPSAVEPSAVEPFQSGTLAEKEHMTSSVPDESFIGTQGNTKDRGLEDHGKTPAFGLAQDTTVSNLKLSEPEHSVETTAAPSLSLNQPTVATPSLVEVKQPAVDSEQVASAHDSTDPALNADSDPYPNFSAGQSVRIDDATQDAGFEKQEAVEAVERSEDLLLETEPSIPAANEQHHHKDEDFTWASSKKSKKDKKKKRSNTSGTEPSSGVQTPISTNVAETEGSHGMPETSTNEEAETLTQSLGQDEVPAQSLEPQQQIDDWATAPSKKGKKGKQKNRSSLEPWEPGSSTQVLLEDKPIVSPDAAKDLLEDSGVAGVGLATQTVEPSTQESVSLPEPDSSVKHGEQPLRNTSVDEPAWKPNLDSISKDGENTLVAGGKVEDDNRSLAREHVTSSETDPQHALPQGDHHLGDPVTKHDLDSKVIDGEDTLIVAGGQVIDENIPLPNEQINEDAPRHISPQPSDLQDTLPTELVKKPGPEGRLKNRDDTLIVTGGQVADEVPEPWAFQATHSSELATKTDLEAQAGDGDNTLIVAGGSVPEQSSQLSQAQDGSQNTAEPKSDFLGVEHTAVRPQSPVPWEDDEHSGSSQRNDDFLGVNQTFARPESPVPWEDNDVAEGFVTPSEQRPGPTEEPQSTLTSSPGQIVEDTFKVVPENEPSLEEFDAWAPKKLSKKEKRKAKKSSMSIPEPEVIATPAANRSTPPLDNMARPENSERAPFDLGGVDGLLQAGRRLSELTLPSSTNDAVEPMDKPDSDHSPNFCSLPTEIPEHSGEQYFEEAAGQAKFDGLSPSSDDLREPEPSTTETATVEETPAPRRKLSKKEKRKAKKKATSPWEDELFQTSPATDENPGPDVAVPDEESEMIQEKTRDRSPTRSPPNDDSSKVMEATAMNAAVAEDEWSVPLSRKKSKKDKKKGKLSEPTSGAQTPLTEKSLASIGTQFTESSSRNLEQQQPIEQSTEDASDPTSPVWASPAEHLQIPSAAQGDRMAAANEGTELQRIPSAAPSPDIWENEDYFKPRSPRDPGIDPPEEPFDKVEIHPAFARDLNTSPDKQSKDDRPLVGLGLIHRHSSIFQEDERHTPKLLTMTSDNFSLESVAVEDLGPLEGSSQSGALPVTETAPESGSSSIPHNPIFDVVSTSPAQPANAASARDIAAPNLVERRPISPSPSRTSHDGSHDTSTLDDMKQMARTGSVALLAERFGGTKKGSGLSSPSTAHGSETRFGDDNVSATHSPTGQDAGSFTRQVPEHAVREEEVPLESLVLKSPILGSQASFEMTTDEPPAANLSHKSILDIDTSRIASHPSSTTDTALGEPRPQLDDLPTPSSSSPISNRGASLGESALPSIEMSDDTTRSELMPVVDFRRPVSRGLPPVQEEPQEEEAESGKHANALIVTTPDINRDSGFVADSPITPWARRLDNAQQRDSGVHLRDYPDTSPRLHGSRGVSPEPSRHSRSSLEDEKLGRSPVAGSESRRRLRDETPVLEAREPPVTPEPQKSRSGRSRSHKTYPDLGPGATTATAALEGAALLAGARGGTTSRSPSPSSSPDASKRSFSDNTADKRRASASPQDTPPSQRRAVSNTGISRARTPEPLNLRPDSPSLLRHSATPPLRSRRTRSGDLRSLSQSSQLSHSDLGAKGSPSPAPVSRDAAPAPAPAPTPATATKTPAPASSSSSSDLRRATTPATASAAAAAAAAAQPSKSPVANEGRVRTKDMADVYDGFGEGRLGSPRSPTRPHSMRRRQSMQVLELESRVEQLIAENRALAEAKFQAEHDNTNRATSALAERDNEIETLKQSLEFMRKEVQRLTEVNEGLNSAIAQSAVQHEDRYRLLENQHADATRELDDFRGHHGSHAGILEEKDAEIRRLREQLEATKEQIREMQRQILATKPADSDFLQVKDVDYFDHRCQALCSHVQQWVLRFSKFSDMRACRLTSELNDDKIIDRLDNAILDGSNVDSYLNDRVKRRDIFMSVTMTMIWEFVFTRYLFGMDREQRQKLKALEKLLLEVGPPQAVRQWRAVTLTLLSRRDSFKDQRDQDTEAVVQAVFQTLSMILPPPSNLEDQIQNQLRKVMREAVDLSIEMRTQRAEYMMLPPLQPDYDANGDLAEPHPFNAQLMSERSGDKTVEGDDLQAEGAIVRVVLFPLVVKKGDDAGIGDDEVVVCPAQVICKKPRSSSRRSMRAPSSDAGGVSLLRGGSPSTAPNRSNVSMQEAEYFEGGI